MQNEHPTGEAEPAARRVVACQAVFRKVPSQHGVGEPGYAAHNASERLPRNSGRKRLKTLLSLLLQYIPRKLSHRVRSLDRSTVLKVQRVSSLFCSDPRSSGQHSAGRGWGGLFVVQVTNLLTRNPRPRKPRPLAN